MKIKLFFLLASCLLIKTTVICQTKRALIIAIGNYPAEGGWATLNSIRDVPLIKAVLADQHFENQNIKIVADSQATIDGISKAFESLIAEVHASDVVFIQFSSHGEQVEDDNGDETDCLDESIVSYDAVSPSKARVSDYKVNQAGYFRDDKIAFYINQLRNKLGDKGDIIIFMDLCHSGSGTRGKGKVRGDQPPLVSATFNACKFGKSDTSGLIIDRASVRGNEIGMAAYAVISASRAEEFDAETEDENGVGIGSLTYAMSRAFSGLDVHTTYRSLFAKIEAVMNEKCPGQHPVLEGNGIDKQLWGGNFVHQKKYFEIEEFIDGKRIKLKGGLLAGLDSGAKIAIYPAGTADTGNIKPLGSGTVISAEYFSSTVLLNNGPGVKNPALGWVFITEPVYNIPPVSILPVGYSVTEINLLKSVFKDWPLINFNRDPELIIAKGMSTDSVKIASNGYLLETMPPVLAGIDSVKKIIRNYLQYTFLRKVNIVDSSAGLEVNLVKLKNNKADTNKINSNIFNGIYEFKDGDSIVLWIKNKGSDSLFFNVLDMQPNGVINAILPNRHIKRPVYPLDLCVYGHSSLLFDKYIITIAPPLGTEIFKILVSKHPIDLEFLAKAKGEDVRGNFTFLEKMFSNSYKLGSRGNSPGLGKTDGSIFSLLFRIKAAN